MAAEKIQRQKMRERDPQERARDFGEVALGFDAQTARTEAARCLQCKNAPCKQGCPVGVEIPGFLAALKGGDFAAAAEIIKKTNGLPSVCGRVCPQENQCEKLCVRAKLDGAVAIGACERFAGDYMLNASLPAKRETGAPVSAGRLSGAASLGRPVGRSDLKVAVIGSGPAGLSCAAELSLHGVSVTVFEAFHRAGGVLVYGIPEFRLPKAVVQKEIDVLKNRGVIFELNSVIGKTVTVGELLERFDAVFIGSGAGLPVFMGIKGENLNGVYSANEYLTRVNLMGAGKKESATPIKIGKSVVVVGAGNVAMDAARTALRLGAEKVSIVYRRGREEIPARAEEVLHAGQEGIKFELLAAPVEIIGENGFAKQVKCVRMELGAPDASGRRAPVPIKNSEFIIEADLIIVALGTSPNPLLKESYKKLETNKKGAFVVGGDMMTNVEGIYAGGDAVTGAATVISAMGQGRAAARSILEKLCLSTK